MTADLAPSPPGTDNRHGEGQGLRLNRTMLSNHKLPYVGRFACDWLRLATTDPDAAHVMIVRPPGLEVPELRNVVDQVPVCQEPRYSSWAGVRRSMLTPMVSSFSRAISASMARGTL
jgi:hypothetical protein